MITLTVNGKKTQFEGPVPLSAFLQTLKVNIRLVAVGHNGEVVDRRSFDQVVLQDGDTIDIVHMVGGG